VYCGNSCFDFYDGDIKMNERILSPQLLKLVQAAGPGYSLANPEWVKKFAELIVRECAKVANRAENAETEIRCMYDVITEHFGVEE
jgi:hypothetical protein